MFTINIYVRFALITLGLVAGIGLWAAYGFWYGFLFILASLILLAGYFLLGTVNSSAMLLQKQQFEAAEQQLTLTYFPQWLYAPIRATYHTLKGMLSIQQNRHEEGEKELHKALALGLPSDNETAMIYLQLANIHGSKQKWATAEQYYKQAKSLKVTEPMIKEQLGQFDQAFKQRGQMKAAMRYNGGNFQQGGGKRRRPQAR